MSSHVDDLNTRKKVLQQNFSNKDIDIINFVRRFFFSKFYRRHFDLVSKYNVGVKTLLLQGLSEPKFYGDWCINSENC